MKKQFGLHFIESTCIGLLLTGTHRDSKMDGCRVEDSYLFCLDSHFFDVMRPWLREFKR